MIIQNSFDAIEITTNEISTTLHMYSKKHADSLEDAISLGFICITKEQSLELAKFLIKGE